MSVSVSLLYRAILRPVISLSLLLLGLTLLMPLHPAYALEKRAFQDILVSPGVPENEALSTFGDVTVRGPVEGDVASTFGNVEIYAPVEGNVEAEFGDVYIDSRVRGDVDVGHGEVDWGPGALVGGDFHCPGCELEELPRDRIAGEMKFGMDSRFAEAPGDYRVFGVVGWFFGSLVFVAVAVLAAVFAPRQLSSAARKMDESFGRSLLVGLASVPAAVVLSVVLAVSLVGIPLLLLAAPVYLAFVFFGALVASYFLGRRVLVATGRYHVGNALAAAIGALILCATYLIPFVGSLLLYGLALTGTGATLLALFSRRSTYPSYGAYVEERRI